LLLKISTVIQLTVPYVKLAFWY